MAPKVLFLRNEPMATEALLADAFADHGFAIETFEVVPPERIENPAGEVRFPDPAGYDVIVPLGATWPVYDEALRSTWVGDEMQLMRTAAEGGTALLGVCFGGQLLAQTFGGTVSRSPHPEVGWYDVASDRPDIVPGGPWFQWHFDRWTLPPGATELARTTGASQAFVLGRAMALQFHPEVDADLLTVWLAADHNGDVAAAGFTHDELLTRTNELAADTASRIHRLVGGFLTHVAGQLRPS
ncbi:glutamine amidotransferase [Mycolicibacterium cyprinidarum]|uniref:Glutamine amidotransferase n=1 Tax=Mycolicibacterium cyprinidarum TaxID=2860311 RepID=A0ABQ4VEB9_9MYCO|nr:glutamine amidotransferase [Mycolicibacterium sp. NGTWS0302]GJF17020.1 glutamine amidotransferase [Mycolicibacterium sp. NGTWS1803]GJF19663.1 glutamine amidotransferase [Mycolicibacterium sp. NGTWSNA01]